MRATIVDVDVETPDLPDRVRERVSRFQRGDAAGAMEWFDQSIHGGADIEQEERMKLRKEGREEEARTAQTRSVKVTDVRDLNELLRLPNPLRPTEDMQLQAITTDSGVRLERPSVEELRKLKPSKLRPVFFHWKDMAVRQTMAPKQYDEFIQRLMSAGPIDCEDIIRANWRKFDQGFYFRLTELMHDCQDDSLRDRFKNLEQMTYKVCKAADAAARKMVPEQAEDAKAIMNALLQDGDALLWPPPAEAYKKLADTITQMAIRNKYSDAWFETMVTMFEGFGEHQKNKDQMELFGAAQIMLQRLTTEWLRSDGLWEETAEGQFLYRLMSLSHEQWGVQLSIEKDPLDVQKLRDEIKIISETKVMKLPMGSKLQVYAAKYLQGLVEFVQNKDQVLRDLR
jgi:hypothetical protein